MSWVPYLPNSLAGEDPKDFPKVRNACETKQSKSRQLQTIDPERALDGAGLETPTGELCAADDAERGAHVENEIVLFNRPVFCCSVVWYVVAVMSLITRTRACVQLKTQATLYPATKHADIVAYCEQVKSICTFFPVSLCARSLIVDFFFFCFVRR